MIQSINISTKLYVGKAKDFKNHKDTLLELISLMPSVGVENVSKSDWLLASTFDRLYLTYFYKHIGNSYMCDLMVNLKLTIGTSVRHGINNITRVHIIHIIIIQRQILLMCFI